MNLHDGLISEDLYKAPLEVLTHIEQRLPKVLGSCGLTASRFAHASRWPAFWTRRC